MMRTHGTIETATSSGSSKVKLSIHCTNDKESEIAPSSDESKDSRGVPSNPRNLEFGLHQPREQDLIVLVPIRTSSTINSSVVSAFENSVVEQTRANDLKLKAYEISLIMEKFELKDIKLALDSESNYLDRFKHSVGLSKASFEVDKFKTHMEDSRHAELLKSCNDCLVGQAPLCTELMPFIQKDLMYTFEDIQIMVGSEVILCI